MNHKGKFEGSLLLNMNIDPLLSCELPNNENFQTKNEVSTQRMIHNRILLNLKAVCLKNVKI